MMNARGIVMNNTSADALLRELKDFPEKYDSWNYKTERGFIESIAKIKTDQDGKPVLDKRTKEYRYWEECTDPIEKNNLFLHIPYCVEYIGSNDTLRKTLSEHHIRRVFNLTTNYAQNTRDYDNLIAKGMFGLVVASEKFNPFKIVTKSHTDENGRIIEEQVFDKKGNPKYIKFITYATPWIKKYIRQEFNDKKVKMLDNMTTSLDVTPRLRGSTDHDETMIDTIEGLLSPDVQRKTINDELSANDLMDVFKGVMEFVNSDDSSLSSMERQVIVESFCNHKKTKEIADELNTKSSDILNSKKTALAKLRTMMSERMNINEFEDIFA